MGQETDFFSRPVAASGSAKVTPASQKEKDQSSLLILQSELQKTQDLLKKGAPSNLTGKDKSDYLSRIEGDIAGLNREIYIKSGGKSQNVATPDAQQEQDFFTKPIGVPEDLERKAAESPYIRTPRIRSQAAIAAQQPTSPESIQAGQQREQEGNFLKNLALGGASLADTTIGGVLPMAGQVVQAVARPFTTPERAAQIGGAVTSAVDKPFGKAVGSVGNLIGSPQLAQGTQSPAYQNELTNQIMQIVSQYGEKSAEIISQKFNIPLPDAQNMVGTLALGGGVAAAKGVGAVSRGISDVKAQLSDQFAARQAQTTKPNVQANSMQSGGAAAAVPENVLRGNIDAALSTASPELQAHIKDKPAQSVNIPALETRTLEEKHGVNLLTSQRTGDTQGYSEAWNSRSKNGLVADFEQQPKQLANAFELSKQRNAPDIPSTADASELGQITINSLAAKDQVRQQAISAAYKALEDANGGQFPIDTGKLKQNVDAELLKKYKSRYLSKEISGDLDQFLASPTFDGFEALRTNLADEMRSAKDGKTRQAAFIVRDELEKLPIFGEESGSPQAIQLKGLADNARKLYAERKKIIENNPAYKAAIKESANLDDVVAQGESLNADKFHQKFVSGASPEAIRRMKAELAPDDLANQAIAFAELERTKRAITNANETRVKADTFAEYLRKNKSVLREALPPDAMQDVMEIGLLNSKIGKPDAGTFNYSNSWSSMMGDLAKEGLLGLGEAKLAAATSGASIPAVGGLKMMFEKMNKDAFANSQRNPYGGLTKEK
jgi:hypothetical protein